MELYDYLNTLSDQIRCKKARPAVLSEIKNHISDQTEACEAEGLCHRDALAEALRQMGDPVEAGIALDRVHRPRMEWGILVLVLILSAAGLVLQYAVCQAGSSYSNFYQQCFYVVIGLVCMFAVYFLDYSLIGQYPLMLWLGYFLFLLCISVFCVIPRINGQLRIYNLLTLFVPLYAGILFRCRGGGYARLLSCGLLCLLPLWICVLSVQTTGLVEIGFIFLVMMSFAIIKRWFQVSAALALPALWGGVILFFLGGMALNGSLKAYQLARIQAWLHPGLYQQEANYQRSIVLQIVSQFRLTGKSPVAHDYLSAWQSDFNVTLMFSYFGILTGSLVILLILLLIFKGLSIAVRQKNQLGALVGLGCCLILFMQSFTYIAANFGIGLLTQKTIPFLTYGLQGTVANYILIGLLLSIYRFKDILPEKKFSARVRYRIRIEKID